MAVVAFWLRAFSDLLHARISGWRPERVPLTVVIDERTGLMMGSDVRYAWRALLRQRGATALVVFMLALGIAANVTVFGLVYINTAAPKWNLVRINYPDFDRWRKDQKAFVTVILLPRGERVVSAGIQSAV